MYLEKGKSSYEVAEMFGVSRKNFFKWLKRYREYGREGLINKKAGAKTNRRRTFPLNEDLIVKLRLDTPFGPVRIAYELKRRNLNKLPAFKEEKETIRYEKKKPFKMEYVDAKYVGNLKGQGRVQQSTPVDDATRITYAKLYRRKTALNGLSFLKKVIELSPFRIQSILTDNGLEFTNIRGAPNSHIIDEFCLKNNIKHKLTRKRRPQTNGKVERFYRTVGEESYSRNFYFTLEDMEKGLEKYDVEYYNKFRPHMGINGFTPYEKLKELQGRKISKDFKVSNILPFDKICNFGILDKDDRKFCSHPIQGTLQKYKKEVSIMAIRQCKDCPCFERKKESAMLGLASFDYGWCNKFKTRKDRNQDACSWAKERARSGGRFDCR